MVQGNHVHALGESITFGRFTSKSLDCENWLSVPQKSYVEEAKSYTQPGSVAEKKAFFDAYYKRLAAQKAAAAALLEQEREAAATALRVSESRPHDSLEAVLKSHNIRNTESLTNIKNCKDYVYGSVDSKTSQMNKPLLKSKLKIDEEVTKLMSKRKPAISSLVSSVGCKPSRIPPSPSKYAAYLHHKKDDIRTPRSRSITSNDYIEKRRETPKSSKTMMNSSSVREPCKKIQTTKPYPSVHTTPKRGATPMKTPVKASVNGVNKHFVRTPSSVNRRMETPVHPTAGGSKSSAGTKWRSAFSKSLSAYKNNMQSPTILSPFVLRTEDRAARRKKKLEEKFNEKQAQHVEQQMAFEEKADMEIRRLRQSLCFKARPLPEFYKGRETPKNQKKKTPEANPKSFTPRRKGSPFTASEKKISSRRLWKTNEENSTQHTCSYVAGTERHEKMSPNIQNWHINTHKTLR
uniref:protein WVD2-like 7 n=1 Tax=Erigeron canadensis TaxID=72917 RepID=UPI001CB99619|nr:protein WVD2-like 7 [Erigeron canadensis]